MYYGTDQGLTDKQEAQASQDAKHTRRGDSQQVAVQLKAAAGAREAGQGFLETQRAESSCSECLVSAMQQGAVGLGS